MKKVKITFGILFFCSISIWGATGLAADFPQKPIRMIIPWGAGGGTDVLCRAFQPAFEKELGQKILIENIPAGASKVGTLELMKAKPDGYTLIFSTTEGWVHQYYSGTYDSIVLERMTPIGNVTSEPTGFFEVRIESPFKTWADLVKAAKANPEKPLSCGAGGSAGGIMELMLTMACKASGIQARFVPFPGGGPSKIAMLGGHVDFRVCQPTEAITMIRAEKSRGLAVSTDKRMAALPDVPTFKELGIGLVLHMTRSIWGPPNLPSNLVDILTKAMAKAMKDPAFIKVVQDDLLYTVDYKPPQEMRELMRKYDKEIGWRLKELNK